MSHSKNRRRLLASVIAFCLCLLAGPAIIAQQIDPDDVIKVNTDLVVLDAQVIDKKTNKIFGGLRKEDFELYEENVRQDIVHFSQDRLPLSVLLLLDISGSVRPIIEQIGEGAHNALRHLRPEDEVAVMAFATDYKLLQTFSKDRDLVASKIVEASMSYELGRGTMLNEALYEASLQMNQATNPANRRAIIVVTDNVATATGTHGVQGVKTELFESGTVVYGLVVRAAFAKVFNVLTFGKVRGVNTYCEDTGGEVLGADRNEVDSRLGEMFTRLRTRYTLGYRPPETNEEGVFRRLKVQLTPAILKTNKKLIVRSRLGYYFRKKKRVR
jgi:VWFA-related protein